MEIPFFDLHYQFEQIKNEIYSVVSEIFETQRFILGKYVTRFEQDFAAYCGTKYAVAVSSGTDALLAALMAIDIKPGDEVILPDFTFFATAGVVQRLQAKPVFVDIDPLTYNINTNLIENLINEKTRAIIPVHIFGQCVNMEQLFELSEKYNIPVIEDACQAIGASYSDGRLAGNLGLMGCFSFYPTKNLGGAGDSGAITTNDDELYLKLKQMRNHGMEPRYYHHFVGGNFRMDEIQAAVLSIKLKYVNEWNNLRRINQKLYHKYFIDNGLSDLNYNSSFSENNKVIQPYTEYFQIGNPSVHSYHTFHQYCVRSEKRNELRAFLSENKIGTDVYYPVPLHQQRCFEHFNYADADFPATNRICCEILALPIFPEISELQIRHIVEKITAFYN